MRPVPSALVLAVLLAAGCQDEDPPRGGAAVPSPPAAAAPQPAPAQPAPAPLAGIGGTVVAPAPAPPPAAGGTVRLAVATLAVGAVIDDAAGDHGTAVTQAEAWHPLIRLGLPPGSGELRLRLRVRGGPVCAKAILGDGSQRELGWYWGGGAAYAWAEFGPFPRADLGSGVMVIRDGDPGRNQPVIGGAEWVASAPDIEPSAAEPVAVAVDWNAGIGSAGAMSFGTNLFHGFDAGMVADPRWQAAVTRLAPGLVRIHNGGSLGDSAQPDGWVDTAHRTWDAAKIARVFAALRLPPGCTVLLNVLGWPGWMDADHDGFLDPGQEGAYAAWCADLVRIVNRDLKAGVGWWEPGNEQDGGYGVDLRNRHQPDRMAENGRIYLAAARAMKAVDPAIRVGGNAAARADQVDLQRTWVAAARECLDFYSFHAYASGSAGDDDEHIYDRARYFGEATRAVMAMVHEATGRDLPVLVDEYNISWTWETRDRRMTDHKGAVFDALALAWMSEAGAAGTTRWNEWDGIYGAFGADGRERPQATLLHWLNAWGPGRIVRAASDRGRVLAWAVEGSAGRLLMLVNRTGARQTAVVDAGGWSPSAPLDSVRIEAAGCREAPLPVGELARIELPRNSVLLVHGPLR